MCCGARCSTQRAEVMMPSQPSFCTPGRPPRNLSVTSLPRPALRNFAPSMASRSLRRVAACSGGERPSFQTSSKRATGDVVDLAEVVIEARHLEPVAFRIDHAPPGEIVDGRAPQHRFLAAGIHRNVAADAARRRPRSDRPRTRGPRAPRASLTRRVTTPASVNIVGARDVGARQRIRSTAPRPSSFSVLITARPGRERHGAARVTRAAAARNHGEAELDALAHQVRNLRLGIGGEHQERQLDPPIGRVRDVSDPGIGVEAHVVGARVLAAARGALACAVRSCPESAAAKRSTAARAADSSCETLGERRSVRGIAALLHFAQPVVQSLDELGRGASDCRSGRPAGTDCGPPPRCRPAPRTACAPSGRCAARARSSSSSSQAASPSRRITISRSESEV